MAHSESVPKSDLVGAGGSLGGKRVGWIYAVACAFSRFARTPTDRLQVGQTEPNVHKLCDIASLPRCQGKRIFNDNFKDQSYPWRGQFSENFGDVLLLGDC